MRKDGCSMTYGELLLTGGIVLIGLGVLTLIIGAVVMTNKKRRVREQMYDRYGL